MDLTQHTISTLSELMGKKEVSPVEVVEAALNRVEEIDGRTKAFVTLCEKEARQAAQQAEKDIAAGNHKGPLHGIPLGIKDIYYTEGVPTTGSSKVFKDFIPDYDATTVKKLKEAGAIILGKTNTHEFAFGVITPPTRNPWDLERIPGGSSGGTGAAVATAMCMGGTGSDTGGSIRIPSSLNGIVGIKPTFGRTSKYGVIPLSWSLDHTGPMCRSVRDAAVMLEAMAGFDAKDPYTIDLPVPHYAGALEEDVSGLRLGVPTDYFSEPVDPQVGAAVEKAVEVLRGMAASVEEVSLPHIQAAPVAELFVLCPEASSYHDKYLPDHEGEYSPDVLAYLKMGYLMLGVHHVKAQRYRRLLRGDFEAAFRNVDAIVTPTLPITAPKAGDEFVKIEEEDLQITRILTRNMVPYNLTGLPAITLPCGFDSDGLPIGLQIAGRAFDESTIFRLAHAYESATDWMKTPPL